VRVTHLASGRSVVVRINDRGPFIKGRIIDLSRGAAGKLGIRGAGIAKVKVEVIGKGSTKLASGKKSSKSKVANKKRNSSVASLKRKQKAGSASAFVATKKTSKAVSLLKSRKSKPDLV
jgi:rare lipoprotein A